MALSPLLPVPIEDPGPGWGQPPGGETTSSRYFPGLWLCRRGPGRQHYYQTNSHTWSCRPLVRSEGQQTGNVTTGSQGSGIQGGLHIQAAKGQAGEPWGAGTPGRGHANGGGAGRETLGAFEEHGKEGQVAEAQARESPRRGQREPEQALVCQVKVCVWAYSCQGRV